MGDVPLMQEAMQAFLYLAPVWLAAIVTTILFGRKSLFKRHQVSFISARRESILGVFLVALTVSLWILLKIVLSPVIEQIRNAEGPWPNYSLAHMALQLFASGIGFAPFAIALLMRHQGLSTIGLSRHNLIPSVFLGIVLSGVTITSYVTVYGKAPTMLSTFSASYLYYLVAMLSVGFAEEAIFRGYLQLRLTASLGTRWAWVLTAIVFTIGHVEQSILGLISVFVIGFLFGWIMIRSENIVGLSIWHAFIDWVWIF